MSGGGTGGRNSGGPLVVGIVVGALLGFGLGAGIYVMVSPWLEAQTGLVREMQGMAWNLVPGLTLLGGGLGAWWALARRGR